MIGSKERPYTLHWPAPTYERIGDEIGFEFSESEFRRARDGDGILGVRRYMPSAGSDDGLPLPAGTFVSCRLQNA